MPGKILLDNLGVHIVFSCTKKMLLAPKEFLYVTHLDSAINCQNKTKFDMWQQSNSCPKAGQKNVTYVNDNYTLFLSSKRSF